MAHERLGPRPENLRFGKLFNTNNESFPVHYMSLCVKFFRAKSTCKTFQYENRDGIIVRKKVFALGLAFKQKQYAYRNGLTLNPRWRHRAMSQLACWNKQFHELITLYDFCRKPWFVLPPQDVKESVVRERK